MDLILIERTETKQPMTLSLYNSTICRIKDIAERERISPQNVVRSALNCFIRLYDKEQESKTSN